MMMSDDKKKRMTMIISKIKGKESPMEKSKQNEMGDEVDDSMPKVAAAEELVAALEAKDAKAIAEAFESMVELCSKSEDYE